MFSLSQIVLHCLNPNLLNVSGVIVLCFSVTRYHSFQTHHDPEVLQVLELGEVLLQLRVDGLVLHLRVFQERPELLQSVQLTCSTTHN